MGDNSYLNRLELVKFKLSSLLEITRGINSNLTQEELLQHYENLLRNELNIGKILIFKLTDKWECLLNSGFDPKAHEKINVKRDLLKHNDIVFISSDKPSNLKHFDIIIPVIHNNKHIAFVLIGDIDEESTGISPIIKHLNFIQTLSNIIIVATENIRLNEENIRQAAIKRELEVAAKLQAMLIPDSDKLPNDSSIKASAFYHPHFDVGGDYYDFIQLGSDEYGFCMADVSGKGISAAIVMSNFQANLRALFTTGTSLSKLITVLNDRINESTKGERFITMFIGKYNSRTRRLKYINAGHNPPLLYNMTDNQLKYLNSNCVGIGMLDEIPVINEEKIKIDSKSKLLFYTDGLVETLDDKNIEMGTRALEKFILNQQSVENNINEMVENYGILEGNKSIFDDISIMGFEFH